MQIGDFNIRYNELHPDVCYAYELFDDAKTEKYSMFTMDGGETFLTSVTDIDAEMKSIKIKFVDTFHSTEEGIDAILKFIHGK